MTDDTTNTQPDGAAFTNRDSFYAMVAEQTGDKPDGDASDDDTTEGGEGDAPDDSDTLEGGEAQKPEDDDDDVHPDANRNVPYTALKKARSKANEYKESRAEIERELIRERSEKEQIIAAVKAMVERQEVDGNQAKPDDDDEFEPLDSEADKRYKSEIAALRKEIDAMKGKDTETEEKAQARQLVQNFTRDYTQAKQAYSAKAPDYAEAEAHVFNAEKARVTPIIRAEAKKQGWTQAQIDQHIHAQAERAMFAMVLPAYHAGDDVADVIYGVAKASGYAPKPKKAGGANEDAIKRNREKSSKIAEAPGAAVGFGNTDISAALAKLAEGGKRISPADFRKLIASS